ncbi:hypothetical protein D3C85_871670 [compost metagenome]
MPDDLRRGLLLRGTGTASQHPVHLFTTTLCHGVNGWLYGLLPGLTGEHPGNHLIGGEEPSGIGVTGHVDQAHVGKLVRHLGKHFLIQGGIAVLHAHLADQQGATLADQPLIGRQLPLRVSNRLHAPERQQGRTVCLPDTRSNTVAQRPLPHQCAAEPGRLHVLRVHQHQVQFELVIGDFCHPAALRAVWWEFYKMFKLLLKMDGSGISQQREGALCVTGGQGSEQVCVLAHTSPQIPGRAVRLAVLQTGQGFLQLSQGLQTPGLRQMAVLYIANLLLCVSDQTAVSQERHRHSRSPQYHQRCDGNRKHPEPPESHPGRTQPGGQRLRRVRQHLPAIIFPPVMFHTANAADRGGAENDSSQRQRAVRTEQDGKRPGDTDEVTGETVG